MTERVRRRMTCTPDNCDYFHVWLRERGQLIEAEYKLARAQDLIAKLQDENTRLLKLYGSATDEKPHERRRNRSRYKHE